MGGFDQGFAYGIGLADRNAQHKQNLADWEFQNKFQNLLDQKKQLQVNLGATKDKSNNVTDQSKPYLDALTKNEAAQRELLQSYMHPKNNPGALDRLGRWVTNELHITKPEATEFMVNSHPKGMVESGNLAIWNRPRVQNADGSYSSEYSVSFRDDNGHEVLVPTVVDGKFLTPDGKKPAPGSPAEKAMFKAAWDHYLKTGQNLGKFANAQDADAYAQALHSRGETPKHILELQQQQKQNAASDQAATRADVASTPLSPAFEAAQKAQEANQAWLGLFQTKMDQLKKADPNMSDDDARRATLELMGVHVQESFGAPEMVKLANGESVALRFGRDGSAVDLGGNYYSPEMLKGATLIPKPTSARTTNADEQRNAYRLSHHIPADAPWTWEDEMGMRKGLATANPFAGQRMDLAQRDLALREQEDNFRDYVSLNKQTDPLDQIIQTGNTAKADLSNPTGPGDAALTIAFFNTMKEGATGIRFTQTEQNFIVKSRGIMDAAQAAIDRGFAGTLFSPDQRRIIVDIIQKSAANAQQKKQNIINATRTFKPAVAAAASQNSAPISAPSSAGMPMGATHKVLYEGHWYWADNDGNNLGEVK
ncbi:MAG TPA: hypothetical protein VFW94_24300 [Candidatus Acidoferrales bacterium]|nr:hypothetical protein [Candidatus Acidoferrales bacterium]